MAREAAYNMLTDRGDWLGWNDSIWCLESQRPITCGHTSRVIHLDAIFTLRDSTIPVTSPFTSYRCSRRGRLDAVGLRSLAEPTSSLWITWNGVPCCVLLPTL